MKTVMLSNERLLGEVSTLLSEGKSVTLRAKGNSMLPFIVGGRDSVILKKKDKYRIKDIVLAEISSSQYVLHRIVAINEDQVTLMGDGNLSVTEQCSETNIHGYVTVICKKKKKVNCNSKIELFKVILWKVLIPIRRYLLAIYKRIIL